MGLKSAGLELSLRSIQLSFFFGKRSFPPLVVLVYVRGSRLATEVGNMQRPFVAFDSTSITKVAHEKACLEMSIVSNMKLL